MPNLNGILLSKIRHEIGLTKRMLSQTCNVSESTITRAEKGRNISLISAEKIAKGLSRYYQDGITVEYLSTETATIEKENKPTDLLKGIPDQNALIRFRLSNRGRLEFAPALNDQNDYETIEALRSELLSVDGPISTLNTRYNQNPNVPQAEFFGKLVSKYREELSKNPEKINYATLYSRGARFYAARETAKRQVADGEWPEPAPEEQEAIDAICALNGPLIMSSAVGRQIIADAHEYETTPDAKREEQEIIGEFGSALASEEGLFEPEDGKAISDHTAPIEDDPQPTRSRAVRLIITGSALTAIVGGVAWLSAGASTAIAAVPIVAGLGTASFVWEVVRKTETFGKTTDELASSYDKATLQMAELAIQQQEKLAVRMNEIVNRRSDLFLKIADLRPEFEWIKKYIKKEKEIDFIIESIYYLIYYSFENSLNSPISKSITKRLEKNNYRYR